MRNPGGHACIVDPEGGHQEFDTFICARCNRITHVRARASMGSLCKACMGSCAEAVAERQREGFDWVRKWGSE
jgi:hypothetical protein